MQMYGCSKATDKALLIGSWTPLYTKLQEKSEFDDLRMKKRTELDSLKAAGIQSPISSGGWAWHLTQNPWRLELLVDMDLSTGVFSFLYTFLRQTSVFLFWFKNIVYFKQVILTLH